MFLPGALLVIHLEEGFLGFFFSKKLTLSLVTVNVVLASAYSSISLCKVWFQSLETTRGSAPSSYL